MNFSGDYTVDADLIFKSLLAFETDFPRTPTVEVPVTGSV